MVDPLLERIYSWLYVQSIKGSLWRPVVSWASLKHSIFRTKSRTMVVDPSLERIYSLITVKSIEINLRRHVRFWLTFFTHQPWIDSSFCVQKIMNNAFFLLVYLGLVWATSNNIQTCKVPVSWLNAIIQGPKLDFIPYNQVTVTILVIFHDNCVFYMVIFRNFRSISQVSKTLWYV